MRPLVVVSCGSPPPPIRALHGDFPAWFQPFMGDVETRIWDPRSRASAPDPTQVAGVLIPGSESSLADGVADWMDRAARYLQAALASDVPILGVCFGHQLLAHATGAEIEHNPTGASYGALPIERAPAGEDDPLFASAPPRFDAHESHRDHVVAETLPGAATILASSGRTPVEAVRYRPGAYGLQFHPEFTADICAAYARLETDRVRPCSDTPAAAALLGGWADRLRGGF